jgi:hypothetical protein
MPTKYQRKTTRKSRLQKLNVGAVRTGDLINAPLELDWQKIESVYRPLSAPARERIRDVLRYYIDEQQIDHDAPYLRDALSKLSRLSQRATALLTEHRTRNSADSAALAKIEVLPDGSVNEFLARYLATCVQAAAQLREDSQRWGFKEGHAWRFMILRLFDIVEEFGLPSTVAKKNEETLPSPFVAFVEEIQRQLPPVHWSFPQTHQSLAAAIVNVRRKRKEWVRRQEIITPAAWE